MPTATANTILDDGYIYRDDDPFATPYKAFIKFSLPAITGTVKSATFWGYQASPGSTGINPIEAYVSTASWSEADSVATLDALALGTQNDSRPTDAHVGWIGWDVTTGIASAYGASASSATVILKVGLASPDAKDISSATYYLLSYINSNQAANYKPFIDIAYTDNDTWTVNACDVATLASNSGLYANRGMFKFRLPAKPVGKTLTSATIGVQIANTANTLVTVDHFAGHTAWNSGQAPGTLDGLSFGSAISRDSYTGTASNGRLNLDVTSRVEAAWTAGATHFSYCVDAVGAVHDGASNVTSGYAFITYGDASGSPDKRGYISAVTNADLAQRPTLTLTFSDATTQTYISGTAGVLMF